MNNCSHSELIRLTHELDIFASFLHKQTITWNGIIVATDVNDLKSGRRQVNRSEKIGLLLFDIKLQYFITVKLSRERALNC